MPSSARILNYNIRGPSSWSSLRKHCNLFGIERRSVNNDEMFKLYVCQGDLRQTTGSKLWEKVGCITSLILQIRWLTYQILQARFIEPTCASCMVGSASYALLSVRLSVVWAWPKKKKEKNTPSIVYVCRQINFFWVQGPNIRVALLRKGRWVHINVKLHFYFISAESSVKNKANPG